ncbi:hypothetical protein [Hymenobacter cheonanensis]|uniref:hypothetical protein n=1 Tax=Hymenobacter sp. CA2-7 TaxID=3063993 RepID=UPI0027129F72|nr:hypothetical protein [Hymenobacter sp. CA2-7]MDO7887273.1 hypothetical protein [Hymenobacter sp. CA2-7]
MRFLWILGLVCCLALGARAQKISYDIPKDYRALISKADYQVLVDSAVAVVARRYPVAAVHDGTITLRPGQPGVTALNLHNLIAKCAAQPDKTQWPGLIRYHFTSLFSSFDEQRKIDPRSFESVRPYLSLRIYPEASLAQRGGAANLLTRIDLEGTATVLMLDLPGAFSAVPKAMFAEWHQEPAAVFALAQANVNKHTVGRDTRELESGPIKLTVNFIAEENYAASYALDLAANAPEFVGEWGSVVAIPNKGLASICQVSRAHPVDFVQYIQGTRAIIERFYQEHEQPVSPAFYWYYQGKFTRIVVTTNPDGSANVIAPPGLSALMTAK